MITLCKSMYIKTVPNTHYLVDGTAAPSQPLAGDDLQGVRAHLHLHSPSGDDGQRIFVLNMLPDLVDKIVGTVEGVSIDRVSVIDSGNGQPGIPGVMSQLPAAVIKITEQIENATGVDILSNLGRSDETKTESDAETD